MSSYVRHLNPMSMLDFKVAYYHKYPNSTYTYGKAWINCFIKEEDHSADYNKLWNTLSMTQAEEIIYTIIDNNQWDMYNLQPLRDI